MRKSSKLPPQQSRSPSTSDATGKLHFTRAVNSRTNHACLRELDAGARILIGNAGDHPLILQLLSQAHQCSLAEDFQSRLDEPSYEPSDRLLIERQNQLIGHVRVSKQVGWFHRQRLPIAMLQDFFLLPEFKAAAYDDALLEAAESVARCEGSLLGLVRTDRPEWFREHGWSCCNGQGYTRANTRAILAHFNSKPASRRRRDIPIEIRTWRHFELDSLRQIYGRVASKMWGALHRSEATWQWLAGRKVHAQILIALKKTETTAESALDSNIVGYAVVRDSCIVEMMTLSGYTIARSLLVERACRDAIDRDHHFVSLHTPASDPIHELFVTAGGNWLTDVAALEGKWMLKLFSPERWVERIYPMLQQRAENSGIVRPVEIVCALGDTQNRRLLLTRRSSRLEDCGHQPAEVNVRCNPRAFQDLLAGNLNVAAALEERRIRVSSDETSATLGALFPPELLWLSPFPLLRL
ncbi:MAG: hypothetical protein KDA57_17305 [Planctomycetales bacterium]|nr:hypothetical protein [Planctomycetales bacterium]